MGKFALQIYGQLRSFANVFPDVLHYIGYCNDFDVFILLDQNDSQYSQENLDILIHMLGGRGRIKALEYVNEISSREKELVDAYKLRASDFSPKNTCNDFVTVLWFRRYLINKIRQEYQQNNNISYDYVIRTRFDIGFIEPAVFKYDKLPLVISDIISIGDSDFIDYESELGLNFPFSPNFYFDKAGKPNENMASVSDIEYLSNKWLFMSEANHLLYLEQKYANALYMDNNRFKIVRYKPLISYGRGETVIDVSHTFDGSSIIITHPNDSFGDPLPGQVKRLYFNYSQNEINENDLLEQMIHLEKTDKLRAFRFKIQIEHGTDYLDTLTESSKPTYVYIHVCAINSWQTVLKNLLDKIKEYGIYDDIVEIRIGLLGDTETRNHIIFSDPKIRIVAYSEDKSTYERLTLEKLYNDSVDNDFDVLYLHTKGVSYDAGSDTFKKSEDWTNEMLIKCLENPIFKYKVDCVGTRLIDIFSSHFSGNFWWSRSSHIRKLPKITKGYLGPEMWVLGLENTSIINICNGNILEYAHIKKKYFF